MSVSIQRRWATLTITVVSAGALVIAGASPASAASIGLGEATSFSVLAGQTVTNTGSSVISGNLGVSPGSAVTGFPPGSVTPPSAIFTEAAAASPKDDLTNAYLVAAGLPGATPLVVELGGLTLSPGVYSGGTFEINQGAGELVLDGGGNTNAEWVFQISSTLITFANSRVRLQDGASPCNVFWQVGSSATLGTDSFMVGTVMALTDIEATTGASVTGRLLARNAAVTLDTNTITTPAACIEASSFSGPGGVPLGLPDTGIELPWAVLTLSLVAILVGATGVVLGATRRRAARP